MGGMGGVGDDMVSTPWGGLATAWAAALRRWPGHGLALATSPERRAQRRDRWHASFACGAVVDCLSDNVAFQEGAFLCRDTRLVSCAKKQVRGAGCPEQRAQRRDRWHASFVCGQLSTASATTWRSRGGHSCAETRG
jgi:hypothetical protein